MKLKNVPRSLSNLPKHYALDVSDKLNIKKYREEKASKRKKSASRVTSANVDI